MSGARTPGETTTPCTSCHSRYAALLYHVHEGFVRVQVKENGEIRSHDMVCTYEEIQDLLSKCREAIKQVDRILVTAEGDRM
jgi:hypothetical protein